MATVRYCAYDDKEVRAVRDSDPDEIRGMTGTIGKGPIASGYYHTTKNNCGRQFLTEDQTYTEGDSDFNPSDQY